LLQTDVEAKNLGFFCQLTNKLCENTVSELRRPGRLVAALDLSAICNGFQRGEKMVKSSLSSWILVRIPESFLLVCYKGKKYILSLLHSTKIACDV